MVGAGLFGGEGPNEDWTPCGETVRGVLIDGSVGSGKSALLNYAVHAARDAGCLVVFVPSVEQLTNAQGFSKRHPEDVKMWHHPATAIEFCRTFGGDARERLSAMPIRAEHSMMGAIVEAAADLEPVREAPATLLDLAEIGAASNSVSSFAAAALLNELPLIEKHHVVLAIDEANMLFYDTQYVMDFKPVPVERVLMPSILKRLVMEGMPNGTVVTASSYSNPLFRLKKHPWVWEPYYERRFPFVGRSYRPHVLELEPEVQGTLQLVTVPPRPNLDEIRQFVHYMEVNGLAEKFEHMSESDFPFLRNLSDGTFSGLHKAVSSLA